MAYAICRINKLKSGQIGSVNSHNRRETEVPNADPNGETHTLVGEGDSITNLVADRIAAAGIKKPRKDAVHAVEIVLSASPEYFRPDNPAAWGEFDPTRLNAWSTRTQQFLEERYGDRLVSLDLHLDEATPHAHAVVVPLVEKQRKLRGKDEYRTVESLCAKDLFNKGQLVSLQSDYAAAVKDIGLHRGVQGSKAKHERVSQFYTLTHSAPLPKPKPPKVKLPDPPRTFWNSAEKLRAWLDKQAKIIEERIENALQALSERYDDLNKQADAYYRRAIAAERRLLAFTREYGTPEGIDTLLADKDAQIASLTASEASTQQVLDHQRDLLDQAAKVITDQQSQIKHLEFEVKTLKPSPGQKGPGVSLD